MEKIDGVLTDVTERDLRLLNENPKKFWEGVTEIGYDAFFDCESLKSITIPDGIIGIGAYAFALCASLQSVTVPNSVKKIGGNAFAWCNSLQTVEIPDGVELDDDAFAGCFCLKDIPIGGVKKGAETSGKNKRTGDGSRSHHSDFRIQQEERVSHHSPREREL